MNGKWFMNIILHRISKVSQSDSNAKKAVFQALLILHFTWKYENGGGCDNLFLYTPFTVYPNTIAQCADIAVNVFPPAPQ